jgi:hypothetical protein
MRRLASCLTVIGALGFAAPAAQAAEGWWEGNIGKSSITNCASIIQNAPYSEDGAWSWVGFWGNDANWPDAGQVFYAHTVVGGVGNACSGQRAWPELSLPSGVGLSVSAQNPIYCWALDFNAQTSTRETGPDCPQDGYTPAYGGQFALPALTQSQAAYTWPLPQGKGWEFWVPVTSNRQLRGTLANPCDCVSGYTKIFDGNSSPVLQSNAGLVNDPAGSGGGGGAAPTGTTPTHPVPAGAPGGGGGGGGGGLTLAAAFPSMSAPTGASAAALRRSGLAFTVLVGQSGSRIDATLSATKLSAKTVVLGKLTKKRVKAGKAKLSLKLTRAAKKRLRRVRSGKLVLRVTVSPPAGSKVTKTRKIRLRR